MKEGQQPFAESAVKAISRRTLLRGASAATVAGMIGSRSLARTGDGEKPTPSSASGSADKTKAFPDKFLWGCATAGHQVEGNNTSSDLWLVEHLPDSMFKEPSGDACDQSRIEPEEGFFSNAELEHYRRMLATCREHHLTTLLTYSHFSTPRWFAFKGGWQNPAAPDLYARFCEKATRHLGDLVRYASTFNEPDIPQLLNWITLPGPQGTNLAESLQGSLGKIRKQLNTPEFANFFAGDAKKIRDGLLAAHHKGKGAMKSVRSDMPVGFNLAMSDDQPAPEDDHLAAKRADVYAPWLDGREKRFASPERRRDHAGGLGVLSRMC